MRAAWWLQRQACLGDGRRTCLTTRACLPAVRHHPACSYEHFYVVYCKFWELDSDHDFSLDKNDLARYNNCALTYQIVERIFEEVRLCLYFIFGRGSGHGAKGRQRCAHGCRPGKAARTVASPHACSSCVAKA